jgi:D-beta-D-heptose 7-phosphate kinase/D-beta-D-heptose 1-phosphate adenosyltransferase
VIDQMKGVAMVVFFDDDTPHSLIQALCPDVLVKGADYTEDQIVGADIVRNRGGQVLRVHLVEGQSTTRIIRDAGQGSP